MEREQIRTEMKKRMGELFYGKEPPQGRKEIVSLNRYSDRFLRFPVEGELVLDRNYDEWFVERVLYTQVVLIFVRNLNDPDL